MSKKPKVILTGASGNLSKHIVDHLSCSYDFIGIDLIENNGLYKFFEVDLADLNSIQPAMKKILSEDECYGLINCAGTAVFSDFVDRNPDELINVTTVNMLSPILITQVFMEHIGADDDFRVINFGSIFGCVAPKFSVYTDTPRRSSEIYGMSKAGIINFTAYLVSQFSGFLGTFNCISPGGVEHGQGPDFIRRYSERTPKNRMARPEEIVGVVEFLLGPSSSYINGENILVDGGFTKW